MLVKYAFRGGVLAAALVLVMAGQVMAAPITITASVGGAPTGVILDNLDWLNLGNGGGTGASGLTFTFTPDGQAVQGSVSSQYAAPFLSGNNGTGFGSPNQPDGQDATTYATTGLGNVTITMPADEMYFGLLWGSVDNYNTLSFYHGDTLVGSVTGSQVLASPNGDQGVNGTVYVNLGFDTPFDKVVATSSQYAFEFDNVAFNPTNPVPEPASLVLLGMGLLGAGCARRKRRG